MNRRRGLSVGSAPAPEVGLDSESSADVAQLVEHFTRNEGVRGSNPRVGFAGFAGEKLCSATLRAEAICNTSLQMRVPTVFDRAQISVTHRFCSKDEAERLCCRPPSISPNQRSTRPAGVRVMRREALQDTVAPRADPPRRLPKPAAIPPFDRARSCVTAAATHPLPRRKRREAHWRRMTHAAGRCRLNRRLGACAEQGSDERDREQTLADEFHCAHLGSDRLGLLRCYEKSFARGRGRSLQRGWDNAVSPEGYRFNASPMPRRPADR